MDKSQSRVVGRGARDGGEAAAFLVRLQAEAAGLRKLGWQAEVETEGSVALQGTCVTLTVWIPDEQTHKGK